MIYLPIEELLADGEFHSGQEMAENYNISRVAIWKQIQRMKQWGLELECVRGKGYRIPGGLDLLDANKILENQRHDVQLVLERSVTSTNELVRKIQSKKTVYMLAEHQQQGRGRQGKPWYSPFASNIYLSSKWRLDQGMMQANGLSLVVALTIVRVLEREGVEGLKLKWPNDIQFQGRKLAGILIELEGDLTGSAEAIIGLGLNYNLPEKSVIDQPVATLKEAGCQQSRNQIINRLIGTLEDAREEFLKYGFARFRPIWQQYDVFWSERVIVRVGSSIYHGVAQGVDDKGGLKLLLDDGGIKVLYAGTVRKASDIQND